MTRPAEAADVAQGSGQPLAGVDKSAETIRKSTLAASAESTTVSNARMIVAWANLVGAAESYTLTAQESSGPLSRQRGEPEMPVTPTQDREIESLLRIFADHLALQGLPKPERLSARRDHETISIWAVFRDLALEQIERVYMAETTMLDLFPDWHVVVEIVLHHGQCLEELISFPADSLCLPLEN